MIIVFANSTYAKIFVEALCILHQLVGVKALLAILLVVHAGHDNRSQHNTCGLPLQHSSRVRRVEELRLRSYLVFPF
ncbi:hypothetical protein AAHC03_017171 [Spirometra sp. Aus1]